MSIFSPEQPGEFCYDCLKVSKVSGSGILSIKCHIKLFSICNGCSHQKGTKLFLMIILDQIQKIEDFQHTSLLMSVVWPRRKTESMKIQCVLLTFASDLLALRFTDYGLGSIGLGAGKSLNVDS